MGRDRQGHVYIGGNFLSPNAQFGSQKISSGTSYAIYVAKLDADGQVLWVQLFRGKDGNSNHAYDIATDDAGNVFVTGRFSGPLAVGSTTLTSINDQYDTYVIKLAPSGAPLWAVSLGGSGEELSYGIAVDAQSQPTIVGYTTSTSLGGKSLDGQGGRDIFVARFSSAGQLLWVSSGGTGASDGGQALTLGEDGSVFFVGGVAGGAARFGDQSATALGSSTVVGKLDGQGKFLWTRFFPSSWGYGIDFAPKAEGGLLCVGGWIQGTTNFDEIAIASGGGRNGYVACLDKEGKARWARVLSGSTPSSTDYIRALAMEANGTVHAAGVFDSASLTVGTQVLQNKAAGKWDFVLARYNSKGDVLLAESMGGALIDEVRHVEISDSGGTFVFGNAESKDFDFQGKTYPFQSSVFAILLYVGP